MLDKRNQTLKEEVAELLALDEYPLLGVERDVQFASGVADFTMWDDDWQMEVVAIVSEEFSDEALAAAERLAAENEADGNEHPMGVVGVLIVGPNAAGWRLEQPVWIYRDGDLFRRRRMW
jgi:hypothetical protein